jgi:hypothetical protein
MLHRRLQATAEVVLIPLTRDTNSTSGVIPEDGGDDSSSGTDDRGFPDGDDDSANEGWWSELTMLNLTPIDEGSSCNKPLRWYHPFRRHGNRAGPVPLLATWACSLAVGVSPPERSRSGICQGQPVPSRPQ